MILLFWFIIMLLLLVTLVVLIRPLMLSSSQKWQSSTWVSTVLLVVLIPLISIVWYREGGSLKQVEEQQRIQQKVALAKAEIKRYGSPRHMIERMRQHLEQHQQDAHGWYLLGKLYLDSRAFNEAEQCFAKANALKPNQPAIMVAYAQAEFLMHQGRLPPHAKQRLNQVLVLQPHNPNAVNLLAVDDFARGHYQRAVTRWKTLLKSYPADSRDGRVLRVMITRAADRAKKAEG